MRRILSIICLALIVNGCGDEKGSTTDPAVVTITPPSTTPVDAAPSAESVELAVDIGAVQCGSNGTPLEEWVRQLTANGVEVRASSCGSTGKAYATVCGAGEGRIAIVEVPSSQESIASAIGFFPLSTLPDAFKTPCR